jgi:hypothetical protein
VLLADLVGELAKERIASCSDDLRDQCRLQRWSQAGVLPAARRHPDAAVTSLSPALSCRSCRLNPPFAELVRLSQTSVAGGLREEHRRRILGD